MKRARAFLLILSGLTAVPFLAAEPDLRAHLRAFSAIPSVTGSEERLAAKIHEMLSDRLSVEEETGLHGARAMAASLSPDYVFAVDTFVSSDSPLENKRFGYAGLGRGAVLRAIDSSNITPQAEIRKVLRLAEKKGIPVQVRNSCGGNDGSVFVAGGTVDIPLSWPGAYAHSFIEKIDMRDLDALASLIKALAKEFR